MTRHLGTEQQSRQTLKMKLMLIGVEKYSRSVIMKRRTRSKLDTVFCKTVTIIIKILPMSI